MGMGSPPTCGICVLEEEPLLPDACPEASEEFEPELPDAPLEEPRAVCPRVLPRLPLAELPLAELPPAAPPAVPRLSDNTVGFAEPASAVPPPALAFSASEGVCFLLTMLPPAKPFGLAGRLLPSVLVLSVALPAGSELPGPEPLFAFVPDAAMR